MKIEFETNRHIGLFLAIHWTNYGIGEYYKFKLNFRFYKWVYRSRHGWTTVAKIRKTALTGSYVFVPDQIAYDMNSAGDIL